MIFDGLVFDLLIALPFVMIVGTGVALCMACAIYWRLSGWAMRLGAAVIAVVALLNPSLEHRDGVPLNDIILAIVDESTSTSLGDRRAQTSRALNHLQRITDARGDTDLHIRRVGDAADGGGTALMAGLTAALLDLPKARIAGIVVISDGQAHDILKAPNNLPAPVQLLLTGNLADWDRHLEITNAPKFAVIDEDIEIVLRVNDIGAVPTDTAGSTILSVTVGDAAPLSVPVPTGQDLTLPVRLTHAGINTIRIEVANAEGEITGINNSAIAEIHGVRDRLRVLLVSGQPHSGQRTWRNLLKADSNVDLVHFTILRPAGKNDFVPRDELSLIAIPTNDLFNRKINDFDLIIFDRYKRRGILPRIYLENVVDYVRGGGAVLVAAGPDFASADSLYYSPLADILPAEPTGEVVERGYLPALSETGERHPVTQTLTGEWGRWMRQIAFTPTAGETVMSGDGGRPLLQLARVGEGRVALLGSDHAWLWSRGFEGGGPQAELLRRLAHWMMKEPELDEEKLWGEVRDETLTVWRRSLAETVEDVTVTAPDGTIISVPMTQSDMGLFRGATPINGVGLYRLEDAGQSVVVAATSDVAIEYEHAIATEDILSPLVNVHRGGVFRIEQGLPRLRDVREGRVAAGRGWFGAWVRDAEQVTRVTLAPIAPVWVYLILIAGLMIGAWMREARR